MSTISVRLDDQDTRLIKEYAKAKNITISTLVRDAVLDRIEDEIDLQLYNDSMEAHRKKSEAISFDDMMKELDLE
ncbi:type II toxin-antitoxin system RelB family antitoxin [Exiguobacterium sp. 22311]|uniref:type II toxin-antitoxin system RelB family antitoxin n=1 Tax=Exiguobacterium sp. 22311 TaxID=3453907 RepID=UPI003F852D2A